VGVLNALVWLLASCRVVCVRVVGVGGPGFAPTTCLSTMLAKSWQSSQTKRGQPLQRSALPRSKRCVRQHGSCRVCSSIVRTLLMKLHPHATRVALQITTRLLPVFHNFFLEFFPRPSDWYQRRLAYSRSMATNSIVGYVTGLGDRHTQNILIHTHTAEIVHVDFGVAFESVRVRLVCACVHVAFTFPRSLRAVWIAVSW